MKNKKRVKSDFVGEPTSTLEDIRKEVSNSTKHRQVREAQELARKLMGIPDLHSIKFVTKNKARLLRLYRLESRVHKFLESVLEADYSQQIVYAHKKELLKINKEIRAFNEYRIQNPLLSMGLPELEEIDMGKIQEVDFLYLVDENNKWSLASSLKEEIQEFKSRLVENLSISTHSIGCGFGDCTKGVKRIITREDRDTKEMLEEEKTNHWYCKRCKFGWMNFEEGLSC